MLVHEMTKIAMVAAASQNYSASSPTTLVLPTLKKCFEELVAQSSEHMRLCFFIDGLDEYDGEDAEHFEIAEFFL
jgi:hypothetical protein